VVEWQIVVPRPHGNQFRPLTIARMASMQPLEEPSGHALRHCLQNLIETFKRFVFASVVVDLIKGREQASSAGLQRLCFDLWCEALWKNKTKPGNITLTTDQDGKTDMAASFH